MPDKTVSIVNGVLRVNGMARGRIVRRPSGRWTLDPDMRHFLNLGPVFRENWPTRKAAADWVKERLFNEW